VIRPVCIAILLALAILPSAWAADAPTAAAKGSNTGLPVPRFVSLGADKVNVRSGPGDRYPITWQFQRRALPVEITAEFEYWRRIRDIDGAEGWVHKNLLNGRRFALITGTTRSLFTDPSRTAEVVLQAEAGVQGRVLTCRTGWCRLEIEKRRGWLPQDELWGVYPNEVIE
jgi:SH3-like domain-containing protein